jgi:hypothetical protein
METIILEITRAESGMVKGNFILKMATSFMKANGPTERRMVMVQEILKMVKK